MEKEAPVTINTWSSRRNENFQKELKKLGKIVEELEREGKLYLAIKK